MEKVDWTGTINNVDRLSTIPNVVKGLKIKPNTCNEVSSEVDLSRFDHVRKIDVGSNAFQNVDHLTMNGLNKLTSFEMGVGSFNGARRSQTLQFYYPHILCIMISYALLYTTIYPELIKPYGKYENLLFL